MHLMKFYICSYSVKDLLIGSYGFRVLAVSLAGEGKFSEFHKFQIVIQNLKPEEPTSKGWIVFGVISALLLASITSFCYYYRHKIITGIRRQDDQTFSMKEIELTDFNRISMLHKSVDNLSDIMEYDE